MATIHTTRTVRLSNSRTRCTRASPRGLVIVANKNAFAEVGSATLDAGQLPAERYVATNRFRVKPGAGPKFEKRCVGGRCIDASYLTRDAAVAREEVPSRLQSRLMDTYAGGIYAAPHQQCSSRNPKPRGYAHLLSGGRRGSRDWLNWKGFASSR